jgi:hypothetical protein
VRPRTAFAVPPRHILRLIRNSHLHHPMMKKFFIRFQFLPHLKKSSVLFTMTTILFLEELKKLEVFIYLSHRLNEREEHTYPFPA